MTDQTPAELADQTPADQTPADQTPAEHAEAAAEAIRALAHITWASGDDGWQYPSDAYDVVGSLDQMAMRLPQALDQIAQHIERLAEAGRVRSDNGGDGTVEVIAALDTLTRARAEAEQLEHRLATVHAALAPLSYKA